MMMFVRAILGLYLAALLVATHWPGLTPPGPSGWDIDKLIHVAAYAGVVTLSLAAIADHHGRSTTLFAFAAVAAIAVGALDELTQPHFGRVASMADFLADVVGVLAGLLLAPLWFQRWRLGIAGGGSPRAETLTP